MNPRDASGCVTRARLGHGKAGPARAALAFVCGLAVLAPSTAGAQTTHEVDAMDDFWSPEEVTAAPGDTVRWSFDQAVVNNHNVFVRPPGGAPQLLSSVQVPPGSAETAEYTPAAEGTYDYYCSLHGSPGFGMSGVIRVGTTDPGPIGPQPLPNSSEPPGSYEEGDNAKPKLGGVRITGIRGGVRLRFALSEPGRLEVTISGEGKRVTERLKKLAAGRHTEKVRDRKLAPGSYRVRVRAADKAGNRSAAARARVRIK